MPDRELEFVEKLIKVCRQAQAFYRLFTFAVLLAGILTIIWLALHFSSESNKIYGATGGISLAFSAIPACFFYAARFNEIHLTLFKEMWQDARREHDLSALEKVKNELNAYRANALSKPFWSIK
jgi:hypothetical protein